jgi:hypothetical protein
MGIKRRPRDTAAPVAAIQWPTVKQALAKQVLAKIRRRRETELNLEQTELNLEQPASAIGPPLGAQEMRAQIALPGAVAIALAIKRYPPARVALGTARLVVLRADRAGPQRVLAASGVLPARGAVVAVAEGGGNQP